MSPYSVNVWNPTTYSSPTLKRQAPSAKRPAPSFRSLDEQSIAMEEIESGDSHNVFSDHREASVELSKDLSVRFNTDGVVKSYAFSSNFPDDMARLR